MFAKNIGERNSGGEERNTIWGVLKMLIDDMEKEKEKGQAFKKNEKVSSGE